MGRNLRGRIIGILLVVVYIFREIRGRSVFKMLKSLTKKKKLLVGCEVIRFSFLWLVFLIFEVIFN